jgi:NAD kinase
LTNKGENMKPKFILITRKTRLQELTERFNTLDQARFYIEQLGQSFEDYIEEHRVFSHALSLTETSLSKYGRLQRVERSFLSNFLFSKECIVFCLGQDGLVANTLKYTLDIPVIGINPDQSRIAGKLLAFKPDDLPHLLPNILTNTLTTKLITMAKAQLSNGQSLLAVNDLFIGPKSHSTAAYSIQLHAKKETQFSSGILVSTGLGSTGWMKSIIEGAFAISRNTQIYQPFDWTQRDLKFAIREPFTQSNSYDLTHGIIKNKEKLSVSSLMPESGVIFSDGIEQDFVDFNSGLLAEISVADETAKLAICN